MDVSPSVDEIDDSVYDEEIPPVKNTIILHMIKQLKTGMSLSRITFPSFVYEEKSVVERFSDWCRVGRNLRKMNDEEDKIMRMLSVCTWIIDGIHLCPKTPKVPFKSLRGETTRCIIEDDEHKVLGSYKAELIHHNPANVAFDYKDKDGGIRAFGHVEISSKFLGNSIAGYMDENHSRITVYNKKYDEEYHFNAPNIYGRGILIGKLAMEIGGTVIVQCPKTKTFAKIVFDEKPFLRGRYNCVHGEIFDKKTKKVELTFEGRWSAYLKAKDNRTGNVFKCYDIRQSELANVVYPNAEDLGPYESENIWKYERQHLKADELLAAQEGKNTLTHRQEDEDKWMKEQSKQWIPQLFHYDEEKSQWVPNDIEEDFTQVEMTMPPKPDIPEIVKEEEEAGIVKPINEMLEEVETKIRENDIK